MTIRRQPDARVAPGSAGQPQPAHARAARFPLGAAVSLDQLDLDPHPLLARLREHEPVSWLPALDGWLVTTYELVRSAMLDAGTFTVDDPRFSTAQVIGPSMLSLDGEVHARHRTPFVAPFRPRAVATRFEATTAAETERLIDALAPRSTAELRREFAGPLAASIIARALGFDADQVGSVLGWYDAIVAAVTSITAGAGITAEGQEAFAELSDRLARMHGPSLLVDAAEASNLSGSEVVSNAAVLLFGGIETTEGMIANAILHLLERPAQLALVRADPSLIDVAIEESLRLEPAAAVVDRYATVDVTLGEARIGAGDLVRLSIAGANRDPAIFPLPGELDLSGANGRRHLAFAHGPHVCLGVHLARLEARTALAALLAGLPGLQLDPERPRPQVRGLVFRKPQRLDVRWNHR
jgi:cytochrome P450